ncbi:MAG: cell division protein FtsZ [Prevotella sp.]|nr:cell division protein FtsZ [Prevotella sp.]
MIDINDMPMVNFGGEVKESIIKVIGVGGGGGNAVNHMYRQGIHDVSFVVCNTDKQALDGSPVPVHLQLGEEGLGAGNKPEMGKKAAEESIDAIRNMLSDGTRMTFITAGMGGGTGTGAAPIIAKVSKEMDILTVGIVTIPFAFEGKKKIDQALDGVEEMAKHVDALLVINNERLREIYQSQTLNEALAKADDTLTVAAKSIAEIITVTGKINLDFNDVRTVLKDGGVAIMSTGYGEGENRVKNAIEAAIHSPLLNRSDIFNAKRILFNIACGEADLMMEEMTDVHDFLDKCEEYELKWGITIDPELGKRVKATILASGFGMDNVDGMEERTMRKSQEELNKIAEEEARQEARDIRRDKYYGKKAGHTLRKRRPNFYLFRPEDLDNDDVISAVESTPTYKRTREKLDSITKTSSNIVTDPVEQPSESQQGTIKF